MKKLSLISVFLMLGCTSSNGVFAQDPDDIFTIYLVRHSEKEDSLSRRSDPPLSDCGQQRSEHLSHFLSAVNLDVVYSTNFIRTINTAQPTADSKGLGVVQYNPAALFDFSKHLIEKKQNALVVGHSNTTGVLAGLLVGDDIGAFDLDIYDRIYQVVIHNNKAKLLLYHSEFDCKP